MFSHEKYSVGSVFIRSVMEQLYEDQSKLMFPTIAEAMKAVTDLGGSCSLSYAKKLRSELVTRGYITTRKKGKHWEMVITDDGYKTWTVERDLDSGLSLQESTISSDDLVQRNKVMDQLEVNLVVIKPEDEKFKRMNAFRLWRENRSRLVSVPFESRVARVKGTNKFIITIPESK